MRQLALWAVLCSTPLLTAAVDVRGTGEGSASVRGGEDSSERFATGTVPVGATFASRGSRYAPNGLLATLRFAHERRNFEVALDLDLRFAASGAATYHFPDVRRLSLQFTEDSGPAGYLVGNVKSGAATVRWWFDRFGNLGFKVTLDATVFGSYGAGAAVPYRSLLASFEFTRATAGSVPVIALVLPDQGGDYLDPGVIADGNQGCGGDSTAADDTAPAGSSGCGGDSGGGADTGSSGGSDSTPDCGGSSGGDSTPDCGGSSGGGAECSGGGGGVSPNCSAAGGRLGPTLKMPCAVKKRRTVMLRYAPYLAIFAFIGLLRLRVRRRARATAAERTADAARTLV